MEMAERYDLIYNNYNMNNSYSKYSFIHILPQTT